MKRVAGVLVVALACAKEPRTPAADTPAVSQSSTGAQTGDTSAIVPVSPAGDTKSGTGTPVPSTPAKTGDSIVGMVGEHGFDPVTFIAITPAGGPQMRVSGSQLESLGAVKGAEVWARGQKEGNGFRVDTFVVRKANNRDVADGVVSVSGTTVVLRTGSGTVRYPDAPTALREAVGARVWITPPVAGQAPSFGVIRAAKQ